jgi:hypothetical protein
MAKSRIPNPLTRRHLVQRDLAPAQALRTAEAYLAEDRVIDALEFLVKAGAEERLGELRATAVKAGDAFMLRAVARAMGAPPAPEEWMEAAASAEAAGKLCYAADAQRQANRTGE